MQTKIALFRSLLPGAERMCAPPLREPEAEAYAGTSTYDDEACVFDRARQVRCVSRLTAKGDFMRKILIPVVIAAAVAAAVAGAVAGAQKPPAAMLSAARSFLESLPPELKQRAQFPFDSDERVNWYYVPRERLGLPLKAMTPAQRDAAMALLRAGLSAKGYSKAETIRSLEDVLLEIGDNPKARDKEMYYFSIFGEPSEQSTWGWRYEGHHLSQHWTIVAGKALASTPQFFGANPAEVRTGRLAGTRPLAAEEDLAYELLRSATEAQLRDAVIDEKAPSDILTTNAKEASIQDQRGLTHKEMSPAQRALLVTLIEEHAGAQTDPVARERIARVQAAGLDAVRFAWMGGRDKGQGHYYRIQGPTFLVEFDNTQTNANHIHSVWRDFKGDFGRDLLSEHYKAAH